MKRKSFIWHKKANRISCKNAILRTLIYSDLFNFPLNKEELWYFLKTNSSYSKPTFDYLLREASDNIKKKNGLFFLKGHGEAVLLRKERQKISQKKINVARRVANVLSFIPTILFVGLSGSIASGNAAATDDIDFFIIVKKNKLWVSRFFILLFLEFLRVRRTKWDKRAENKVCVNLLVDETQLEFVSDRHDLYTAHEIAQLVPFINKNTTYEKFLNKNEWIQDFMPNTNIQFKNIPKIEYRNETKLWYQVFTVFFNFISYLLEPFVKSFQKWNIAKTRTTETISDTFLAFHPFDYRQYILGLYFQKLKQYHIPA